MIVAYKREALKSLIGDHSDDEEEEEVAEIRDVFAPKNTQRASSPPSSLAALGGYGSESDDDDDSDEDDNAPKTKGSNSVANGTHSQSSSAANNTKGSNIARNGWSPQSDMDLENSDSSSSDYATPMKNDTSTKNSSTKSSPAKKAESKSQSSLPIRIPKSPKIAPVKELQEHIEHYTRLRSQGRNFNIRMRNMKSFRNPNILNKIVQTYGIEEYGSNFPMEKYNYKDCRKEDKFEELNKAHKEAETKIHRDRRKRKKIPFSEPQPLKTTSTISGEHKIQALESVIIHVLHSSSQHRVNPPTQPNGRIYSLQHATV